MNHFAIHLELTQDCKSTRLQVFFKCLFYVYHKTQRVKMVTYLLFFPNLKSFISFNVNKYSYSFFQTYSWKHESPTVSLLLCSQLISALLKFNSHLFTEFFGGGEPTWHSLLNSSMSQVPLSCTLTLLDLYTSEVITMTISVIGKLWPMSPSLELNSQWTI